MNCFDLIQTITITSDWEANSKAYFTTVSVRRHKGTYAVEIVIQNDDGCPVLAGSMQKDVLKALIEYYKNESIALSLDLTVSLRCNSDLNHFIEDLGFELYESNENNNVYKVKA